MTESNPKTGILLNLHITDIKLSLLYILFTATGDYPTWCVRLHRNIVPTMSSTTTLTQAPSSATTAYGKVRYIPAGHTPAPATKLFGLPEISDFGDERTMPLHDVRPLPTVDQLPTAKEGTAQLSTHGFTAVKHPSVMHSAPYTPENWRDQGVLKDVYVPEMEDMVKRITGAKTVITEVLLLRDTTKSDQDAPAANTDSGKKELPNGSQAEATDKAQTPVLAPPPAAAAPPDLSLPLSVGFAPAIGAIPSAPKAHLDFAPAGARIHIRKFHPTVIKACAPVVAAEDRLQAASLPLATHYLTDPSAPRWAIYSVWRPVRTVKRDPLAMGDIRTFTKDDYVEIDVPMPTMGLEDGKKEMHSMKAYAARGSKNHRWCYVSEQKPDEVLIVGLWDSDRERDSVGSGGAMHSSVEMLGSEGEDSRVSVELRCLAVW